MKELLAALNKFNAECPAVEKGAQNPFFKSKYATLDAIQYIIQPYLSKNGLVLTQCNIKTDDGFFVETRIYHMTSDAYISSVFPILFQKNTPQEYGSAITYARRYSLTGLLNVRVVDESDDDGNTSSEKEAKPWLTKKHADYSAIKQAIVSGARTIEQLKSKFLLSPAVEADLKN